MRRALPALPVVALTLAGLDSMLVRRELSHRPVEAALFLQAAVLWVGYATLALIPTYFTLRQFARRRAAGVAEQPLTAALVLFFWCALPVATHSALDAFTSTGQNVSGLLRPGPWLALLGTGLGLFGLAVLLARLLARAPVGAVAAGSTGLALVAGLFLPANGGASAADGEVAGADQPNLLLLVWDTCRADHTAPYGSERETTPNLARFADESLVFEEARSVSVFTFTSHLSMLTGVLPSVHGARLLRTQFDPRRAKTMAELLREEGYRTGAFVGTDVLAGRTGMRHGFEVYGDRVDPAVCDTKAWQLLHDVQSVLALALPMFRNNGRPHWFQDFQRPADDVLDEALDWIASDDPRPWFCMVNLYDVHWPYLPADDARDVLVRDYNGALDGYLFRADGYDKSYEPTPEDARHVADLYDAEILQLDRTVDAFLGELDLDRTAVLLTSDHGESFGEAGKWKHEHIFEPQLRVPFLLRVPGGTRSGRVPGGVSGIDVAPTLLGLAGVAVPDGVSGLDLLATPPDAERLVQVEDRDHLDPTDVRLALYRGPWKLIRRGLGEAAVFSLHDLRSDLVGEIDVSAEHPGVRAELEALLVDLRGDLDEIEAADALDLGAQRDALEALGYMGD